VPTTVEETTTETREVGRTPDACLRALDLADRGFTIAGEAFGAVARLRGAVSRFDTAAMERELSRLTRGNRQMQALAPEYRAAKEACRDNG
jgi:hypothetical protein